MLLLELRHRSKCVRINQTHTRKLIAWIALDGRGSRLVLPQPRWPLEIPANLFVVRLLLIRHTLIKHITDCVIELCTSILELSGHLIPEDYYTATSDQGL